MDAERHACILVARALGVEQVAITDDLQSVAGWDSLGHMAIVAEIEKHLGRSLAPEQIVAIGSVRDVVAILGAAE
jgi:acyl carrier protein